MFLLLFISAVLYALPFWFVNETWWLIFIFPLPFMCAFQKSRLTFAHGYFWGFLIFAFHLYGIFISLYAMAVGPWYVRLTPIIGALLFLPLSIAMLFLFMNIVTPWCLTPGQKIIRSSMLLGVCITYIERVILWPFDRCEGYMLMHPAVPLAQHPSLLAHVPLLGTLGILILILAVPTCIFSMYVRPTLLSCLMCGNILVYWIYIASMSEGALPLAPAWTSSIAHAPYIMSGDNTLKNIAPQIQYAIKRILEKKPDTTCIVFPESSCHAADFYTYQAVCNAFKHPTRSLDVLIGGFRWHDTVYYNTTYVVQDGVLEGHIDKCHALILTERIPRIFSSLSCFHYIYGNGQPSITASTAKRLPLLLSCRALVMPYICSELLFNHSPHDCYTHLPILFSSNDVWIQCSYIKKLIQRAARVRAGQWQRAILFISYTDIHYIDEYGFPRHIP